MTDGTRRMPQNGWIGLHQDGSICVEWECFGGNGEGMVPLIRFREQVPSMQGECTASGEQLEWARVTVMAQNAGAMAGGFGAVRFVETDDA